MRILVQTIFYRPELTGVAKYTAELCEWLAAQGHEVSVVAPPPYYPQWRVHKPYKQWRYKSETMGGVDIFRCPVWLPSRPGGLRRLMYGLSFAVTSWPMTLRTMLRKPDCVIVIEPSFLNTLSAWIAARICGATAWLHIQDFEVGLAYDLGHLRSGRPFVEAIESWVMKRFDVVSSITPRMVAKARRSGVSEDKLYLLPNWFDPSILRPLPPSNVMREELRIPGGAVVAMFSGSLGAKQGVEAIVEAARRLSDCSNVFFIICGEGVTLDQLRARGRDLNNLLFLPLQPADRLNELLNLADLHLLPQQPSAAQSVMPSKLIGMLASGRPVIAECALGSEIGELIAGCGLPVEPGDSEAFVCAIRSLAADPSKRERMGDTARHRAIKVFSAGPILTDFQRELKKRIDGVTDSVAERFALK